MELMKATTENIEIAAKIVRNGGLIVYPTDTVYGLGCDPFNTESVKRLINVKGEREKPLPILAATLKDVKRIAIISKRATKLAEKFWPGALTLVLRKKKKVLSNLITPNSETVGVRIPNHATTLKLIQLSRGVIVGTSANKTGAPATSSASEAYKSLGGKVDMILDGGVANLGISSTVVDLSGRETKVLRRGSISFKEVLKVEHH